MAKRDWNAWFARQLADRDRERAQKLREAKAAAAGTDKEPFSARKVKALYLRLDKEGVDGNTPWKTLLKEAEYDYYVKHPEMKTLEQFVKHTLWLDGFA